MKKSELRSLIREQVKSALKEAKGIYDKFLDNPENPKGKSKTIIDKFIKQYGEDATSMAADRFIKSNNLTPEEGYIIKHIVKSNVTITSQPGGPDLKVLKRARNEDISKKVEHPNTQNT